MNRAQGPQNNLKKERILQTSLELTFRWIKGPISNYFELLDDRLFKLAQSSDNNVSQAGYFQTRSEITNNQTKINQLFVEHISIAFTKYQNGQQVSTNFNVDPEFDHDDKLSLVDEHALEEALAIAAMSRKCSADCSEHIYSLNQRLSVLRGGAKVNEQENPVAPGVFAEALQYALENLTIDNQTKLVIYKVFEFSLIGQLNSLYEILNGEFKNQGVLPNLGFKIKKNPIIKQPGNQDPLALAQQSTSNLEQQTAESIADQYQFNNSVESIQNQLRLIEAINIIQARIAAQSNITHSHTSQSVPAAQIIATIQQLQRNASAHLNSLETATAIEASNVNTLRQQAEKVVYKSNANDHNVIEIVGLLFEYMLNEQQLPDAVKTLLSYLHTPFLKVALLDEDFFSHPEHPARQLLNSLVAAGASSMQTTGKHKNDIFQKIKSIVQRLLDDYNDDVRLFSELAFEFNRYLREHTRRIQLTEKRSMQAAQGETRLKEIRLKVDAFLKSKTGKLQLPKSAKDLLFEPWANFLSFNLLRFGSNSEQWKQAVQIVDDILWYCQPHNIDNDFHAKTRIDELRIALPAIMKAGFETVGYNSSQSHELLDLLLSRSEVADTNTYTDSETIKTTIKSATRDIDTIDLHQQANSEKPEDKLVSRLRALKPGIWFDFEAKSKNPVRVKLAWVNNTTYEFMFVNALGQQFAIKTLDQIAAGMRSANIKIQSRSKQKPFFESAMEKALELLQEKEKHN